MVDRIIALIKQKGLSINAVEKQLGFGNGAIKRFSTSSPSADKIIILSNFLNVSTDYLLLGEEKSPSLSDDEQELLNCYKKLPERERQRLIGRALTLAEVYEEQVQRDKLISATTNIKVYDIAAGAGISTPFTDDDKYSIKEFLQTDVPSNADCGIYINGDSMEPKYPNGCLVWVRETQEILCGDVIIAILNGEPFCKIYQEDGLYSFNEKYKPIKVTENDNFSVFGKVIGYYVE
ncbi:MAG: S24 family peptidase [Eubacterium sp.]